MRYQRCQRNCTDTFLSMISVSALIILAACQTAGGNKRAENFPIVVGASFGSDVTPCIDYGSYRNAKGRPYQVYTPDGVIIRHEGIDFCYPTSTPVYAAASGEIYSVQQKHSLRGGWITQKSDFSAKRSEGENAHPSQVRLWYLHIVPAPDIKPGMRVKAGDLIAHVVSPAGLPEVGGISHLHFAAGTCNQVWSCHTDPNRFWQNGPGNITCLDSARPPPADKLVSPIGC